VELNRIEVTRGLPWATRTDDQVTAIVNASFNVYYADQKSIIVRRAT
jgi:hypothetical protein